MASTVTTAGSTMTTAASSAAPSPASKVTLAFYLLPPFSRHSSGEEVKKAAAAGAPPLATVQLQGDRHGLGVAAELLFDATLRRKLNAELYDHVWRFEPPPQPPPERAQFASNFEYKLALREAEDNAGGAVDPDTPCLSPSLKTIDPFGMGGEFEGGEKVRLRRGSTLIFQYDEGNPTRVGVVVTGIEPLGQDAGNLPRVCAASEPEKAPEPPGAMDAAFPGLSRAAADERYGGLFFGRCAKEMHGAIEGGLEDNGDQLYAPLEFAGGVEAFLICAEAAWALHEAAEAEQKVRKGWTNLFVFPPEEQTPAEEAKLAKALEHWDNVEKLSNGTLEREPTDAEEFDLCGPSTRGCRLTPAELAQRTQALRSTGFEMAKAFPHTVKALADPSRFVWMALRNGQLQLAVGMKSVREHRTPKKTICVLPGPFRALQAAFAAAERIFATPDGGPSGKRKR